MFNKKSKIEFIATMQGIMSVEECLPKLYSNYMPKWWSDKKIDLNAKSIKNCPAIPDFFSQAYVIPMWADTTFYVDGDNVTIDTAKNDYFKWEFHSRDQFLDFSPTHTANEYAAVAKATCPWNIITPKGYSVYQLPTHYLFNENFEVLPGTIRTDMHYQINQQILIKKRDYPYNFTIKRGDPLAIYIPYKREKYNKIVRYLTKNDEKLFSEMHFNIFSKFTGSYRSRMKESNK